MTATVIGTSTEGLAFTPDDDESHGAPQFIVVDLHSQGLAAKRRVVNNYATGFEDLAEFFEGIADNWAAGLENWTGVRSGDRTIKARYEYGPVQLRVGVSDGGPGRGNQGWSAFADLPSNRARTTGDHADRPKVRSAVRASARSVSGAFGLGYVRSRPSSAARPPRR
jgi:hypothetical protein